MDIISALYEFFYPSPDDDAVKSGPSPRSEAWGVSDRDVKVRMLKRGVVALFFTAGALIAWYSLVGIHALSDITPLRIGVLCLSALLMYFSSLVLVYFNRGTWRIIHPTIRTAFSSLRQGKAQPVLELLAIAGVYALTIGYLLFRYTLHPPYEVTDFDPGTALSFLFVIAFILFVAIVIGRYAEVPWHRIGLVTGLVIAAVAIIFSGHNYIMAILLSAVILLTARFISIRYLQKYG
ncbi:MAG TPA: hypothetical protein VMS81_05230 [Methanomicrobiales archaeon]|nr:hypothetical protein [Methanomicrobiales archaeon]